MTERLSTAQHSTAQQFPIMCVYIYVCVCVCVYITSALFMHPSMDI